MLKITNNKIIRLKKISSTQDYAKIIADKSDEGTIIITEIQTKGRGRYEREWDSQKGGLYFSIILKPQININKTFIPTYKMALAILDTLKYFVNKTELKLFLKWPNDIVIKCNNKYKKISGILTESSIKKNKINWIVIGIGINANNKLPKSLNHIAISLKEITKRNIKIEFIFSSLIKHFEKYYNKYPTNKVMEKYRENSIIPEVPITFINNQNKYTGKIRKIRNDGGIELTLSDRTKTIFYSGDVVLS